MERFYGCFSIRGKRRKPPTGTLFHCCPPFLVFVFMTNIACISESSINLFLAECLSKKRQSMPFELCFTCFLILRIFALCNRRPFCFH